MRSIILILLVIISSCSDKYIPLVKTKELKSEWIFSESGKNNWLPAEVPGLVQTDLFRNEIIEDPLFENNELKLQWISDKDWEYKTEFTLNHSLLQYRSIDFIFEGIDTYANVYLNDSLLLTADNMFIEWRADGRKYVKSGINQMRVVFYSPTAIGLKKQNSLVYKLPASDPVEPRISPFIRKAPYHFGWDWSPRFLTMGLWKPVKIIAHDRVYISDLNIRTIEIADTCAWLSADVTIQSDKDIPGAVLTILDAYKQFKIRKGSNTAEVKFRIFNPELWWPNGYGTQKLYELTAKLFVNTYLVDSATTATGIRTVELFRDDDEWGESFYFRVNGLPIFMKGANYVPQSNFLTEVGNEDYSRLINDAAQVGMNMLRVWGGGIYEKDIFYKLCDEKGILIWQDFMFAGYMIPGDSSYIRSVQKEVEFQIKRLRNHPSIALWCGNNEIDVAWNNWGWQKQFGISPTDSAKIYSGYKKLFEQIIPEIAHKLDPNRPYLPSSPISNWGDKEKLSYGNMHYWGVWHGEEDIDSLRVNVPRFMSEYGMQSYPSFATLKKQTDDERITLNGDFMKNRQRSYKGNGLLTRYVEDYFTKAGNVEDLCYLSQINQAEALKIAIESHRKKARYCMGTLYWQMNDVWDGASWSTIEKNGKWKAAHYALKKLYAREMLIVQTENDTTRIFFQTENTSGQTGTLLVEVMDFKGRIVGNYSREVSIGYMVADMVFEQPIDVLLNRKAQNAFLLSAKIISKGDILAESIHYFTRPQHLQLLPPQIKYDLVTEGQSTLIIITSDVLVKNLMLETESNDGAFSDNYFDLLPHDVKKVVYTPPTGGSIRKEDIHLKWFEKKTN